MTFTITDRGIRLVVQFLCISALAVHAFAASAQTSPEPADSLAASHLADTTAHCILTSTDAELQPVTEQQSAQELPAENAPENESAPPTEEKKSVPQGDSLGVFDMFTNLPTDWYNWSKQTFTTDNIPLITALGVMTAAMVVSDYELWQPARKIYAKSKFVRDVSDRFVDVGDGKFQFGLAVGFGLYGAIFSDKLALRTASQVTEVILACGTVVQILKHLTGRESPFTATTRTGNWTLFPNLIEYHKRVPHFDAFPSGHIATAMATMIVISENYPKQKWIKYIGYPAVALVGVGLTTTSLHWVSDFPLGLALGYSFGMLVAHRYDAPGSAESASSASVPSIGFSSLSDGTPTMQFTWKW